MEMMHERIMAVCTTSKLLKLGLGPVCSPSEKRETFSACRINSSRTLSSVKPLLQTHLVLEGAEGGGGLTGLGGGEGGGAGEEGGKDGGLHGWLLVRLFDSIRYGKSDGGELPSLPMNLKNEADGSAEQ